MNIEIAGYDTIIRFGTLEDLKTKMKMNNDTIAHVLDWRNEDGMSLLEKSLSARNFEVSKYLLDNEADVNVVSKDGNNELHYIAANIREDGALEIAYELLDKGCSVMQRDKRFGNTAFFTLCTEVFKVRSDVMTEFLNKCFEKVTNVDEKNISGYSIRDLIEARGSEELKKILVEKY